MHQSCVADIHCTVSPQTIHKNPQKILFKLVLQTTTYKREDIGETMKERETDTTKAHSTNLFFSPRALTRQINWLFISDIICRIIKKMLNKIKFTTSTRDSLWDIWVKYKKRLTRSQRVSEKRISWSKSKNLRHSNASSKKYIYEKKNSKRREEKRRKKKEISACIKDSANRFKSEWIF